jgi:hypothetical protein
MSLPLFELKMIIILIKNIDLNKVGINVKEINFGKKGMPKIILLIVRMSGIKCMFLDLEIFLISGLYEIFEDNKR